ncbi:hypothetical protein Ciccas_006030 [Cichlidogyrus casuarinus]|uniref:Mediator complex subunit 15 n=1 Tax=Cichlidogyrus casuarinus TaxID=1844966 RepID=A0ABD2Q7H1_9PLAT
MQMGASAGQNQMMMRMRMPQSQQQQPMRHQYPAQQPQQMQQMVRGQGMPSGKQPPPQAQGGQMMYGQQPSQPQMVRKQMPPSQYPPQQSQMPMNPMMRPGGVVRPPPTHPSMQAQPHLGQNAPPPQQPMKGTPPQNQQEIEVIKSQLRSLASEFLGSVKEASEKVAQHPEAGNVIKKYHRIIEILEKPESSSNLKLAQMPKIKQVLSQIRSDPFHLLQIEKSKSKNTPPQGQQPHGAPQQTSSQMKPVPTTNLNSLLSKPVAGGSPIGPRAPPPYAQQPQQQVHFYFYLKLR